MRRKRGGKEVGKRTHRGANEESTTISAGSTKGGLQLKADGVGIREMARRYNM